MNTTYPELNSDNRVTMVILGREIADQLTVLEDEVSAYFDLTQPHQMIKVGDLINTRARPGGIVNANKLMRLAKDGVGSKREPIVVEEFDDNRWIVLDGNSTTINAVVSDWDYLPCVVRK